MDKTHQYERVFNDFDENKDGKISPSELQRFLGSVGAVVGEITPEEAEAVVLLMDSDGDGLLGMDDFIRLVEGTEEEEEKTKDLREAFKLYVREGDGKGVITPNSLRRMLSRLGEKRTVEECKCMIAEYDVNGDGVLNFDEFRIMMS